MADKKTNKKNGRPRRLVLLDAHAILHRAYHALPGFTSPKGEPTGALYGLSAMLIRLIGDLKPDYLAACYDMPGPTFRHEAYEAYKAKRPKAEDDLIRQMNRSRDIFRVFGIPVYEKEGFEADDIIGTIVEKNREKLKEGGMEIIIASGDMDTLQLTAGKRVQVYTLKKGITDTILYDEEAVKERFGFAPALLPDFKGLSGDPSDNIMGVSGIGAKTAALLIRAFGTVENIYKKLKKDPGAFAGKGFKERVLKLLCEGEEEALFSKTLALIRRDAPIEFSLPREEWRRAFSPENAEALFRELNFRTLPARVREKFGQGASWQTEETVRETMRKSWDAGEAGRTAIALWLVDSNITNPKHEDILAFARARSFGEARVLVLRELAARGLERVYREIELPLSPILKRAERRGILLDTRYLGELSGRYHAELDALRKEIWEDAGVDFNINSPKQLSGVLFDRLLLSAKGLRKTEGGARSTRESELAKLLGAHPIIGKILAHRELQKLLSTYIDNLPAMIGEDGRLHTTFVQTGTTTGRMSSVDPNLQNIPIKGERGGEVRRAFVAAAGYALAAFDYSQIELRALAILSGDEVLIRIFKEGKDVHNAVASEVFGVPREEVTREMRRKAKVINFGIIYGMGVTSLEKALGATRAEAQKFYDDYFREFPGVREYIERVKKEAAEKGYTTTLFGRRRYFEGLSSNIPYIRSAAERMAVNAPVQGTATGDIIKLAIVKTDKALRDADLGEAAFLLLQVHDELVYEIKDEAVEKAVPLIKKTMESVVKERVPFVVDASVGGNWGEMARVFE